MAIRLIDLFSGAGGMSLGFVSDEFCGGFQSVLAVDNNQAAIDTFAANFGNHAFCGDVEDWAAGRREVPAADVVVGGPPCQGFSLLNKNRLGDERRALWKPYLDIVERSGAKAFVIENVRELLGTEEHDQICKYADGMGYVTKSAVLLAADFGAPQLRRRAFIFGWRSNASVQVQFPPLPSHRPPTESSSNLPEWRTVWDAISDLPNPVGTSIREVGPPHDLHFGRSPTDLSRKRYAVIPPGGNRFDLQRIAPELTPDCWIRKKSGGTDLFGRLVWDKPSVTIRTEFFKPEKGRYLHPTEDRPITHREAARLMGFPDSFAFKGSKIEIAKQIGNAVPPHLASAVAHCVKSMFKRSSAAEAA